MHADTHTHTYKTNHHEQKISAFFNNPQSVLLALIVLIGHCRGFPVFSFKSGSAISSHNARLCPLMLLALILIRVVLLSTSSPASKIYTHPKKTTHDVSGLSKWKSREMFFLYSFHFFQHHYFCLCVAFFSRNFNPQTTWRYHFLSNMSSNSWLPVSEPFLKNRRRSKSCG